MNEELDGNNSDYVPGDSIERLRKRIYGRGESYGQERIQRPELAPLHDRAPHDWKDIKEEEMAKQKKHLPKKMSYLKLFLIGSGVLALVTMGVAAWVVLSGGGGVSLEGAEISVDAPREIAGGDFVAWEVHVRNQTESALEVADLIFEYPDGARPVTEEDRKTLRRRISLGPLRPGEEVTKTFEAFLFGEEDSIKTARATLEYRAAGSNVILANESEGQTRITQSPLSVFLTAPEIINSGDEAEFTVEISSQADDVLENATLVLQYPEGFSFRTADPVPSFGDNRWALGTIERGESMKITFRGAVTGSELDAKLFRAEIGQEENSILTVLYGVDSVSVTVAKSFLDFLYVINDGSPIVLAPDSFVDVQIRWKNNLSVPVENAIFRLRFEGKGYQEASVIVPNGTYRGTDQTITWNASSYAPFAFLEPGEEGAFNFRFRTPQSFPIHSTADANFFVRFEGTFEALQRPPGFENIDIATTKQHEIKISTDLQLVRKALYHDTVLPGSGPLPPEVGTETIYTVIWSLINSSNDINNLTVKASLPSYVIWKGLVSPQGSGVSYNSLTGEVIWAVGTLPQGTGIIRPVREIRFQIGYIPAPGDVGARPIIVSEVIAEGTDAFTQVPIRETAPAQNTELRSDSQTGQDDWKVAP
ncbi:MAG: hypothetical protein COU47_00985 [Candidatus Niyogibacteria bacterium CG10_big_fil_rev_8_21_14_0_10_46_36]|uniref:DUF11 domain-containing protein n=1 Tax=Candidatus Niyogibacteria bacterium CG10_big_fil_rev_8_21_14_0_10_46_36 TaxID=1974726 RepID=A0A2H0TEL7_9BACT|nr:MAG: hypothetical protein COU47_00985 [Candidatus Niyogibacteria bacterium CG10_big_fil_rev_8_21_14_0_10_46_36]